ncbi:unnamed protein product [Ilex paraguariensis]|uniref:non-specific serine/threonine protein kinase n=1 Tax=Ilex paraguariensis TaxID=185542 RepID=A0ABC8RPR2_9AQUA
MRSKWERGSSKIGSGLLHFIFDNRRLLVYDYVPNNTLYFPLHGEGRPVMDWAMLVKIAISAARGLSYVD